WMIPSRCRRSLTRGRRSARATSAAARRLCRATPRAPTAPSRPGRLGGLGRTDDTGIPWRPMADALANIAVNALVIDANEPDVMFAGTGEGYFREEIRNTGLPPRARGSLVARG